HAYATERVLALGTPKLWITLWFMLLVYYNFNIQGTHCVCPLYFHYSSIGKTVTDTRSVSLH
ncbi:hypothetical protein, partial [Glaesserella parasuis]|uniref:hypothetical protein n=1 Tax=Glaesserella parasuis TaxID=738 RepID=UPI001BE4D1DD